MSKRDLNVRKGTQGFVETVKDAPGASSLGASDIGDDPAQESLAHIREILPGLRTYAEYSNNARYDIELLGFTHGLHNAGLDSVVIDRDRFQEPRNGPRRLKILSAGHKVGVVHIGRNGKPLTELPEVDWAEMDRSFKAEVSGTSKTIMLDRIDTAGEPLTVIAYPMSQSESDGYDRIVDEASRQTAKVLMAERALLADELHQRGIVSATFNMRRTFEDGKKSTYYDLNSGQQATVYATERTRRLTDGQFNKLAAAAFSGTSEIEMSQNGRDGDIWTHHTISASEREQIVKAD